MGAVEETNGAAVAEPEQIAAGGDGAGVKSQETTVADWVKESLKAVEGLPLAEAETVTGSDVAETEAAPQETQEAEPGAAEVEEDNADEDGKPEDSKGWQKRIDKLTRKRREAEEQATALSGQLKAAQDALNEAQARLKESEEAEGPAMNAPRGADMGLESANATQLDRLERGAADLLRDINDFVDDAAEPATQARVERYMEQQGLDLAGLKRHRRDLDGLIQKGIPARRAYLAEHAKLEPLVKQHFPWMEQRSSPEYQTAMEVVRAVPELKRLPSWKMALGIWTLGKQQFDALQRQQQGGAEKSREVKSSAPPPKQSRPAAAPPRQPAGDDALAALRAKAFSREGGARDREDFVKATLRQAGVT